MKRFCWTGTLSLMVIVCVMPAFAQVGYLWTPGELTAKADVVAIVEVIGVRDTGRTRGHPELRPQLPVVEMEAELRVLAWLKPSRSNSAPDVLRLLYFRRDVSQREQTSLPTGPPPAVINAGSTLQLAPGRTRYLAFLSRAADGRYEPLSGHTFPTQSVLRLCEGDHVPC